jgi:long-chain acyl-CoA synthetase
MDTASPETLVANPDVIARYQEEIDTVNEQFAKWEKVKQFRLTPDVWSVEGGHLTPTMKLRRKIVKQKYKHLYEEIYGHPSA